MLLPKPIADGVRAGTVTLAFRRWDMPRVKVGSTQLTAAGVITFDAVDQISNPATLSDDDAVAAGLPNAAALRKRLAGGPVNRGPRGGKGGDKIYRVRMRWAGEDPRIALRNAVRMPPSWPRSPPRSRRWTSARSRARGPGPSWSGSGTTPVWCPQSSRPCWPGICCR